MHAAASAARSAVARSAVARSASSPTLRTALPRRAAGSKCLSAHAPRYAQHANWKSPAPARSRARSRPRDHEPWRMAYVYFSVSLSPFTPLKPKPGINHITHAKSLRTHRKCGSPRSSTICRNWPTADSVTQGKKEFSFQTKVSSNLNFLIFLPRVTWKFLLFLFHFPSRVAHIPSQHTHREQHGCRCINAGRHHANQDGVSLQ